MEISCGTYPLVDPGAFIKFEPDWRYKDHVYGLSARNLIRLMQMLIASTIKTGPKSTNNQYLPKINEF